MENYICPICGENISISYEGEIYEGYMGSCSNCGLNIKVSAHMFDEVEDYVNTHECIQNYIDSNYKKLHDEYVENSTNGYDSRVIKNEVFALEDKVTIETLENKFSGFITEFNNFSLKLDNSIDINYHEIFNIKGFKFSLV